jgi:hypothetical protein
MAVGQKHRAAGDEIQLEFLLDHADEEGALRVLLPIRRLLRDQRFREI